MSASDQQFESRLAARHRSGRIFELTCFLSTWFGVTVLFVLLVGVIWQAVGWLDWQFLTSYDSRHPEEAGILAAVWGSLWLISFTALFSVPIGVGAALYLEEYGTDNWLKRVIQVNLSNLAGVPSIVYGILGLTVFVRMFGLFQEGDQGPVLGGLFGHLAELIPLLSGLFNGIEQFLAGPKTIDLSLYFATIRIPLPFGRTVVSGAATLTLLILPVVIVAAQEGLRAVPPSIRHASYALGATQWQTIRHQVLPAATPGILTGVILAISRAIGETAPLIMIGALTYVAFTPGGITEPSDVITNPQGVADAPFDIFTALPIQIYNWVSRPKAEYQHVAAAGILVLLAVLLVLNAIAIVIRNRFGKGARW